MQNASGLNQIKKELLAFNPEKPFRQDDCIDALASCVNSSEVYAPNSNSQTKEIQNTRKKNKFKCFYYILEDLSF